MTKQRFSSGTIHLKNISWKLNKFRRVQDVHCVLTSINRINACKSRTLMIAGSVCLPSVADVGGAKEARPLWAEISFYLGLGNIWSNSRLAPPEGLPTLSVSGSVKILNGILLMFGVNETIINQCCPRCRWRFVWADPWLAPLSGKSWIRHCPMSLKNQIIQVELFNGLLLSNMSGMSDQLDLAALGCKCSCFH